MTTIQLRRGASAQWTSVNPILHQGELGYETDTGQLKLGDGHTPWSELSYGPRIDEQQLPATVVRSGRQGGTLSAPEPTVIWSFQPTDSSKAPFQWVIGGANFNDQWDTVQYIGYNVQGDGGRVSGTEPAFYWAIEQHYLDSGGIHRLESYFEWISADGTKSPRPIFWGFDRVTGDIIQFELRSKGIAFTSWEREDEQFAQFSEDGSLSLTGRADATGATVLSMRSKNGQSVGVTLVDSNGSAWNLDSPSANEWSVSVGFANVGMRMFGLAEGDVWSLGNEDDSSVFQVQGLRSGKPVILARQHRTNGSVDSGPLMVAADDTGVALVGFDGEGYFRNYQSDREATGASSGSGSALPAAPAGYLTIKDSGGNLCKVPYYNP
jgi:Major tropism determinant N-terminal domain